MNEYLNMYCVCVCFFFLMPTLSFIIFFFFLQHIAKMWGRQREEMK